MARAPAPFRRNEALDRLRATAEFDLVVIGGGITGCGVALDAITRGLSVALLERDDFASGTSSKSSKLVHGGLRYLQQGEIRLVYEALHERQRLRRNAPHLVGVLPFLIPILTRDGILPRRIARSLGSAMWMYDLTGGLRSGKLHRRLRAGRAHAHMPTIPRDQLAGAYLYYDAAADDARLTLTIARTAAAYGAVVANRCAVTGIERIAGSGVSSASDDGDSPMATAATHRLEVTDTLAGERIQIAARAVVNATGVWSDEVAALHDRDHPTTIRPAKGIHITVPWDKVRNDIAAVIPVRGDKRTLFVIPWSERSDGTFRHCYIGTTDTDYDGPLDDPRCTTDDITYVLNALNALRGPGDDPITTDDVTATWAGLRPLVADTASTRTADLSRRHHVAVSDDGVIRVTGGKLTTYREMAADTVDAVARQLGTKARCRTKRLRLLGADDASDASTEAAVGGPAAAARRASRRIARLRPLRSVLRRGDEPGTDGAAVRSPETETRRAGRTSQADPVTSHLADRYGTLAAEVRALIDHDPSLGESLVDGLPYVCAEAVYAVREEMAITLTDVLERRTRAHIMDRDATRRAAGAVAELLAPECGWDDTETARQIATYEALCEAELAAEAPVDAVS